MMSTPFEFITAGNCRTLETEDISGALPTEDVNSDEMLVDIKLEPPDEDAEDPLAITPHDIHSGSWQQSTASDPLAMTPEDISPETWNNNTNSAVLSPSISPNNISLLSPNPDVPEVPLVEEIQSDIEAVQISDGSGKEGFQRIELKSLDKLISSPMRNKNVNKTKTNAKPKRRKRLKWYRLKKKQSPVKKVAERVTPTAKPGPRNKAQVKEGTANSGSAVKKQMIFQSGEKQISRRRNIPVKVQNSFSNLNFRVSVVPFEVWHMDWPQLTKAKWKRALSDQSDSFVVQPIIQDEPSDSPHEVEVIQLSEDSDVDIITVSENTENGNKCPSDNDDPTWPKFVKRKKKNRVQLTMKRIIQPVDEFEKTLIHNCSERIRRKELSRLYFNLYTIIPEPRRKKNSKVHILSQAEKTCRLLSKKNDLIVTELEHLKKKNVDLQQKLQKYQEKCF